MNLAFFLRLVGASLIVLSLLHAAFWRLLGWDKEVECLSPLNARVFAVHTLFIAFVLFALGFLSLARPELLLAPGELPRWILIGVVLFWIVRLILQPLVFDRVMRVGWTRPIVVRVGALLLWILYVVVYGAALIKQSGIEQR